MNNPLHTMCSYMAMFPPSVPNYFIRKYSNEGDTVLDPFSGRGTTVLEACFLGRIGIGNDLNPIAYLLTKAKTSVPRKSTISKRIDRLETRFNASAISIRKEHPDIKMIFNASTLRQLIYLRSSLNWKHNKVDAFIAAMLLGVMHGNSGGYLSLSMPNTFSMSPNYVRGYIKEHKLKKPKRNVFDILRQKLDRCYQRPPKKGKALCQDARKLTRIGENSVDLIVTSPPYTRVIRYGKFNWIRLWFFGSTWGDVDDKLFFSQSIEKYCGFMYEVLKEVRRVLKVGGKAVFVIGDVKSKDSDRIDNLAKVVWEKCAKPLGFRKRGKIIEDVIRDTTKVSKIWGKKKGNATKIDRILILERFG